MRWTTLVTCLCLLTIASSPLLAGSDQAAPEVPATEDEPRGDEQEPLAAAVSSEEADACPATNAEGLVPELAPSFEIEAAAPDFHLCVCGSCCECDCQVSNKGACCAQPLGELCAAVARCTCLECAIP